MKIVTNRLFQAALGLFGITLAISWLKPRWSYVDEFGVVHEAFLLGPLGILCFFAGLVCLTLFASKFLAQKLDGAAKTAKTIVPALVWLAFVGGVLGLYFWNASVVAASA